MKRLIFSLIALTMLSACKKDEIVNTTSEILEISEISNNSATVKVKVFLEGMSDIKTIGVCYSTSENPTINNQTVQQNGAITPYIAELTGLKPNTTYYVRAFTNNGQKVVYCKQLSFTTQAFTIDYVKYYSQFPHNIYYFSQYNIFSIESGTHTIFGSGFKSNKMEAKFVTLDKKETVELKVNVIDDTQLTLQVPDDIVPINPYQEVKIFNLLLNNTIFKGNLTSEPANFVVNNKDINISEVKKLSNNGCDKYEIDGLFATIAKAAQINPPSLLGVLTMPVSRTLYVTINNQLPTLFEIPEYVTATCGGATILPRKTSTKDIYYYHTGAAIFLYYTFAKGTISFQVKQTMSDGKVVESNVYNFNNN